MLFSIRKFKTFNKASSSVKSVVVLLRCRLVKLGRKNSVAEAVVLIIVLSINKQLVIIINIIIN